MIVNGKFVMNYRFWGVARCFHCGSDVFILKRTVRRLQRVMVCYFCNHPHEKEHPRNHVMPYRNRRQPCFIPHALAASRKAAIEKLKSSIEEFQIKQLAGKLSDLGTNNELNK